jgi:transcriptional regulator with XRE-family HTH domain
MGALGEVLKAYREARGLSSRALEAAAGMVPQTLWLTPPHDFLYTYCS